MAEPTIRIGGTAILRNPDLLPLEEAQLKRFAPTIFQRRGIEGVSENYGHVSTIEVVRAMRDNGYEIVEVRQSKRREEERMPFTKHLLKFKPKGTLKQFLKVGDVVPQVVMLNSHDRSSGFQLYYGMYRLICSNGLIVSDGEAVEPIKVRHTLGMVQDIVNKSVLLTKGADGVYALRESMLGVQLTEKAALAFANEALAFRPPRRVGLLDPKTLLEIRRPEDKLNDLWHVYNRVQENLMRGGNDTVTAEGRHVKTKGIGRIERDVQVNGLLWGLAVSKLTKTTGKTVKAIKDKSAANI